MFTEKRIKKSAESKLSAYSGAKDSLLRLKEVQKENRSKASPEKRNRVAFKTAWSVAAAAVITVSAVALLIAFSSKGDAASFSSLKTQMEAADSSPNAAPIAEYGGALSDETLSVASVNAETEFVCFSLEKDLLVKRSFSDQGPLYSLSGTIGEASFEIAVTFGEEGKSSFVGNKNGKETEIAGYPFFYEAEGDRLIGVLETEKERVRVTRCEGASEDVLLAALREIISEK